MRVAILVASAVLCTTQLSKTTQDLFWCALGYCFVMDLFALGKK